MLHQIGSHDRQPIVSAFCPAIIDCDVAALDIACFGQALMKSSNQVAPDVERCGIEETDHGRLWLLRPRNQRPRGCCTKQRDEFSPPHRKPPRPTLWSKLTLSQEDHAKPVF